MSVTWDNQRTSPINVYGPPPTEALVKAAVQYYGISAASRTADWRALDTRRSDFQGSRCWNRLDLQGRKHQRVSR
jgi:hypothetical protein